MGKILSTNLLTYNGYYSGWKLNKILSVPKKIDYMIKQIPGESTFLPVLTYGTAIYTDFINNYVNYIPEVPSSWEGQWTLNPEDIAIHSDSVTGGAMLECYYTEKTGPTDFTLIQLPSEVSSKIYSNTRSYIEGIGGYPTGNPQSYTYIIEGNDGEYYGLIMCVLNGDRNNPLEYCFSIHRTAYFVSKCVSTGITGWNTPGNIFHYGDTHSIQAATGFNASTIQELGEQIYAILSSS